MPFVNFVFFPLPYAFLFLVTFLHCQNKINPTAASTWVSFSIVFWSPISFKYILSTFFFWGRQESAEKADKSINFVSAQKFTLERIAVELTYLHFFTKIRRMLSTFFNTILIIHYFLSLK